MLVGCGDAYQKGDCPGSLPRSFVIVYSVDETSRQQGHAALEHVIDDMYGVADIQITIAVGVAGFQRLRFRTALEDIVD